MFVSAKRGGGDNRESETLTYTDVTNKVAGPLKSVPQDPFEVDVHLYRGPTQQESLDYSIREVTSGSAPGWYVCVSPTSTAPGGGVFSSGSNPSTGISSILLSGDKVRAVFSA